MWKGQLILKATGLSCGKGQVILKATVQGYHVQMTTHFCLLSADSKQPKLAN